MALSYTKYYCPEKLPRPISLPLPTRHFRHLLFRGKVHSDIQTGIDNFEAIIIQHLKNIARAIGMADLV